MNYLTDKELTHRADVERAAFIKQLFGGIATKVTNVVKLALSENRKHMLRSALRTGHTA